MEHVSLPPFRALKPERRAEHRARLVSAVLTDARRSCQLPRLRWRARVVLPAVALLAAILALATPAFGLRDQVIDLFTLGKENRPVGVWSLPGKPTAVDPIAIEFAKRAGVDPTTLREVAAAGTGAERRVLLAGRGPDGTIWIAPVGISPGGARVIGPFRPLASDASADQAIVSYVSMGGAKLTVVDHLEVIGFARSDVASVAVVLSDGRNRNLPLNRWRGFGFAGATVATLPRAVRAFDADGRLIEERPIEPSPVCGGGAAPCADPTR